MTFAKPEMLWLLAVTAPLLAWFLFWSWRKRQQLIGMFVQSRLLAQLTVGVSRWRQKARLILLGLAAMLILLGLARPQIGFAWEEVRQRGLDIIVAVDTSRSMLAADVSPSRLARAKLAALDLMKLARSDRLALVAFAGNAFLQCPLTLDDNTFQQSVNLLDVGLLPQGGTAIGQAIEVALAAVKDSGDNFKALVIFTDGEDHDGDAVGAATKAAEAGMKIFTVGVGTATGDRIRQVDEQGRTTYLLDPEGKQVVSQLNQALLREIAEKTGGDFLPLMGADPMQALYQARLGELPKRELTSRLLRQYHERYQWPLALAILLLGIELFLPDRRRVPRPEGAKTALRAGLPKLVAVLAIWFSAGTALGSSGSALRAYEKGQFEAAQQEYERLLEKHPDDARLQFNAGAAALRASDFAEATNKLTTATRSSEPELLKDVYYNLGNALFRLGERAPAPDGTLANWEQALRHYDSVTELDPNDTDARYNRELVSKKIELLKQQMAQQQQSQPQSQNQQKDDQQDKEKDQQQSQQQKDQQPGDQPDKAQPDKDQPPGENPQQGSQKEDQEPKPEETTQDQGEQEQPQEQQPKDEKPSPDRQEPSEQKPNDQKPSPPQPSGADNRSSTNSASAATAPGALGQMTPDQARQLLEATRLEERPWQPVPPRTPRSANRIIRDW